MKLIMEKFRKNVIKESSVPDSDAYSAGDTEKYPITQKERAVDEVASKLEQVWSAQFGGGKRELAYVDSEILDIAIEAVQKIYELEPESGSYEKPEELQEGILSTLAGLGAAYYLFKKFLQGPAKLMYEEDPEFRRMIDDAADYVKNKGRSK